MNILAISHPQTDTLNPFEISNGLFFGNTGTGMSTNTTDTDGPNSSSGDSTHNGDNLYNLLHAQSHEESKLELADLRRQVVYLQVFARCPYVTNTFNTCYNCYLFTFCY